MLTTAPHDPAAWHAQVMDLLADALELPANKRPAFVRIACAGDESLRVAVERLLDQERSAAVALDTEQGIAAVTAPLAPPKQVGECKIIRELGRGGMSVVYLALQASPVRRTVAVKLLLPGMDTREVLSRFESERQALARMNHQSVAQVFDAGVTETGRPYFLMEYVDGEPITTCCDRMRLSMRQRVELFLPVCEAVQHAHHRAIIHRDLKPSNVLVTECGGKLIPKVIDFGIAKAEGLFEAGRTLHTRHGQILGTPEYMSPEQAGMDGGDVDTRSDVYSLGVMLYELLTGSLPFESSRMRSVAYDEICRMIREIEPQRPSTRLSATLPQSTEIAEARASDPRSLLKHVRGDLDWITMKALEKDRARRYASPSELAADLSRHLAHDVVHARPPTRAYRLRKFVRRHRVAASFSLVVGASLVAGIAGTTWQAIRATKAETHAIEQRNLAEKRSESLRKLAGTLIVDIDESIQTQGVTKARHKLVATALEYLQTLQTDSSDSPIYRELIDGYNHVGNVLYYPGYSHLGDPKGAFESYSKALATAKVWVIESNGSVDARSQLAATQIMLGESQVALNQLDDAIATFAEARAVYEKLATEHPGSWRWPRNAGLAIDKTADVYKRKGDGAGALDGFNQSLKIFESVAGRFPNEPRAQRDVMTAHASLAGLLMNMGLCTDAAAHARESRRRAEVLLEKEKENPLLQADVTLERQRLVEVNANLGIVADSPEAIETVVARRRSDLKADPASYFAKRNLANSLAVRAETFAICGPLEESIKTYEEVLTLRTELALADPNERSVALGVANAHRWIVDVLRRAGRLDEAFNHIESAREYFEERAAANPQHQGSQLSLSFVYRVKGEILRDQGQIGAALIELEKSARIYQFDAPAPERRELVFVLAALADTQREANLLEQSRQTAAEGIALAEGVLAASADDLSIAASRLKMRRVIAQLEAGNGRAAAMDVIRQEAESLLAREPRSLELIQLRASVPAAQS